MLQRADIPKLLLPGAKTEFQMGLTDIDTTFQTYCMTVKSNKRLETYPWLGSTPTLKLWEDERQIDEVMEKSFSITNKSYEATFGVDRDAMDDELYGQIPMRARQMGMEVSRGKDELAAATVEAGVSENAYDGQFFFDTDHEEGESGVQSNLLVGGSYQFSATALQSILTAMRKFKDDKGKYASVAATHVMVPAALEWKAREILDPSVIGQASASTVSENLLKGRLEIIVNPYLTDNGDDSAYFVMDLRKSVKPFIYQTRKEAEFVQLTSPDQIENFMRKEIYFGVDARFAFGYGEWRLAVRAAGA